MLSVAGAGGCLAKSAKRGGREGEVIRRLQRSAGREESCSPVSSPRSSVRSTSPTKKTKVEVVSAVEDSETSAAKDAALPRPAWTDCLGEWCFMATPDYPSLHSQASSPPPYPPPYCSLRSPLFLFSVRRFFVLSFVSPFPDPLFLLRTKYSTPFFVYFLDSIASLSHACVVATYQVEYAVFISLIQ